MQERNKENILLNFASVCVGIRVLSAIYIGEGEGNPNTLSK